MTIQEVFTWIVGPILTFATFVIGKRHERLKWQKESQTDEIKQVQSLIDIYRQAITDLKKELADQRMQLVEISQQLTKLQAEYEELKKLNNELKKSLNKSQNGK